MYMDIFFMEYQSVNFINLSDLKENNTFWVSAKILPNKLGWYMGISDKTVLHFKSLKLTICTFQIWS